MTKKLTVTAMYIFTNVFALSSDENFVLSYQEECISLKMHKSSLLFFHGFSFLFFYLIEGISLILVGRTIINSQGKLY
mgnify:CR=1 FL=1